MAEPRTDPLAHDDFRCSVWTAAQGLDPIGSAPTFDRLVTVEVPQPWPAKIDELEWIAPLDVPDDTRVQAIVPDVGRTDGTVLLTRWQRSGARLTGIDWLVTAEDVPGALAVLVAGHEPAGDVRTAPAEVLVCGHGSRDRCCGGPGTRLTVEARAALPEVRVRRTSHLGGHRFAPTALTLPDGRMWAFLDVDVLSGIVDRTLPPAEAREFYRGNVALDPWTQVVEGAVLADSGWAAVDFDELSGTSAVDGDHARATVTWATGGVTDERTAAVAIAARYPVLQCGLPPGEATKDSAEYRVV
jgi:hypothetical protein